MDGEAPSIVLFPSLFCQRRASSLLTMSLQFYLIEQKGLK